MTVKNTVLISLVIILFIAGCSGMNTTTNPKESTLTEDEKLEQRIQTFLDEVTKVVMDKDFETFYQMWIPPEAQFDVDKEEIRKLFDKWFIKYDEYSFDFIEISEILESDGYTVIIVFVNAKTTFNGKEENGKASVTILEVDNDWGYTFDFDGVRFVRED